MSGEERPSPEPEPAPSRRGAEAATRIEQATPHDTELDAPTRQMRFENSRGGRIVLNLALVVTLIAILFAVLPKSKLKDTLQPITQPYLNVLGVGEDWGVFAPNPRSQVIYAGGVIKYTDGTESVWNFPVRPGIMALSDYRWQKFEEHVRLDAYKGLWKGWAEYLVKNEATPGKTPAKISLVRKWADINMPGSAKSLGPWSQYVYFTSPVAVPAGGAHK